MIAAEIKTAPSIETLRQRAHERLAAQNKSLADLARANSRVLAADEGWECTGTLKIAREVRIEDMRFDNGAVLEFEASGWGLYGSGPGLGVFNVPPSELVAYDNVTYQMSAVGARAVEISFWKETEYLGHFIAISVFVNGAGAGLGKFRHA